MDEVKKITWDNLSISQARQITTIGEFKTSGMEKCLEMLTVLYAKDRKYFEEEISAEKLRDYMQAVADLLATKPDINFDRFASYDIWGQKWDLCIGPKQMTAGQFISFNTIMEEQPNNIGLLLAILLKPKKGKFGVLANGNEYDPEELAKHLDETFPFTKARAIANFFWQASLTSRMLTLRSTRKQLKTQAKKEKERAKREVIKDSIMAVDKIINQLKEIAKDAI